MAEADLTAAELNPRELELLAALRSLDAHEREQVFQIVAIFAGRVGARRVH